MYLPPNKEGLLPSDYAEKTMDYVIDNIDRAKSNEILDFRVHDMRTLIEKYVISGVLKPDHVEGLIAQLNSPDPENWLIALTMIKRYRDHYNRFGKPFWHK